MAAIMLQTIPSFYEEISEKSLFISATTNEKNIVCKDYCIAQHDDRTCSLPTCIYRIVLLGNVRELLKKLDTFCFTYQHVDCLYTLFKYRFSCKNLVKKEHLYDNLQRQFISTSKIEEWTECSASRKKRLLRKKYKKHLLSSVQKTESTQTSGSVFEERIERVKATKFEFLLIKIVDFFLDGQGNFGSNLVSFKTKSL